MQEYDQWNLTPEETAATIKSISTTEEEKEAYKLVESAYAEKTRNLNRNNLARELESAELDERITKALEAREDDRKRIFAEMDSIEKKMRALIAVKIAIQKETNTNSAEVAKDKIDAIISQQKYTFEEADKEALYQFDSKGPGNKG